MTGTVATMPAFFLLLGLLISILASYTMFNFIGNLKRTDGNFRQFWLSGGATVFGIGIWAKHFIILLALEKTLYLNWTMLVALVFMVFFALMSFVTLTLESFLKYRSLIGSLILAFGIAFMSYFTIFGQPISQLQIKPVFVFSSLIIIFTFTYVAFLISEGKEQKMKWLASFIMGIAVVIVQLLVNKGMDIEFVLNHLEPEELNQDIQMLALVVGIAALLILLSTLFTWYIDKRLNQTDERYRLLVENSLDTIAIFKGDQWKYVNKAGLTMFEAESTEQLIGKSIYTFIPESNHQEVKERLYNLVYVGGGRPREQDWRTLQGNILHTEIVETMTTLNSEPAIQVIIRDISERKKNEELLINSEKLYIAGQLAAGIAHEIRNPLTSLKGFLQLIASGRNNNHTYYDIMNAELDRIGSIVSELLMLSKPQVYDLTFLDMRMLMRDTVTLLEAQAVLHDIKIEAQYSADPLWIYGVENQVKQVFINLIKNAIEAMIDGGKIKIHLFRERDQVSVQIHDEGPGFEHEQMAKLGQPFYTTKEKGTGLGLMVSYKIVDNHQGKINVSSEVGRGSLFEIRIPFRYPDSLVTMSS
ncbi:MAG: ATP-binding protein [Candidatus Cohnella colombiensis]|uniref:histidine kinase n=1 Tax=Candidatus Cohnella colombiensis TaxID=3121368 RepID=A0AA95JDC1_9BACL|nr:MAG: ATP-binding protein [Cohnella sp.]